MEETRKAIRRLGHGARAAAREMWVGVCGEFGVPFVVIFARDYPRPMFAETNMT